jgi:hypothetical protein
MSKSVFCLSNNESQTEEIVQQEEPSAIGVLAIPAAGPFIAASPIMVDQLGQEPETAKKKEVRKAS